MSDSPRTGFEYIQRFQPTVLDEIERKAREQATCEYEALLTELRLHSVPLTANQLRDINGSW